ncbi:hypothetical protein [Allosphingosinicella deserti]|uniref:Uncharacterized protein n=1 Tax=Allosphingosinicella deserti TaxID=2116704 RepID=A0A2P7QIS2_9SPHN|nr:hypothetical protein [Sphingomonas deserti]PSJ37877.1 hypothetical protein C7I55_19390 [Sphingomonas deserti]
MRYDLDLLREFCAEIGLDAKARDDRLLEVFLGGGAVLCFQNFDRDGDCLIGFTDVPWHGHGNLTFNDARGYHVELDPLDLLSGLRSGDVLVCERQLKGTLVDRWLVHKLYNDEFGELEPGERIIVRRACCGEADGCRG